MYQISFDKPVHAHFIGIGGISMSGLAVVLKHNGFTVSGSDAHLSPVTDSLSAKGIRIYEGNKKENLNDTPDVVIYTAAIHPDNEEYKRAIEENIPMLTRAQLLGQIMKNYPSSIGVSGTHGKTTTTSMMSHILLKADAHPTISVGGMLPAIGGNIHVDTGSVFLTEACEYTNSFLSLHPTMEIILNIEADHLDFFKDLDDIRHSFRKYMELLSENGILVINSSIKDLDELTKDLSCSVFTYGLDASKSDVSAANLVLDERGFYGFDVVFNPDAFLKMDLSGKPMHIKLSVPGLHNVSNALSAILASKLLGISDEVIEDGLLSFTGTDRRFQKKGTYHGATIIDDYAHHPQEIEATLKAAANVPHKKLWVVFQPHTYTRTKSLFDGFCDSLSHADEIVLAKIYPARETDTLGMSSDLIRAELEKRGKKAHYFETFEEIEDFLKKNVVNGDLLITMGAGDVVKVGEDILSEQK